MPTSLQPKPDCRSGKVCGCFFDIRKVAVGETDALSAACRVKNTFARPTGGMRYRGFFNHVKGAIVMGYFIRGTGCTPIDGPGFDGLQATAF